MDIAIALDIGGSHVTAAAVDLAGRRVLPDSLVRREVPESAPAGVLLDAWAGAARAALGAGRRVLRVGVAMPGPFDYAQGVSRLRHKFAELYGCNVALALGARWAGASLADVPLRFANDAAAWALGEWWSGAAPRPQRMIGITLGTGFGSGFIAGGRIMSESAPDVGTLPTGGELWNAPYLGDIAENFVAGAAIQRDFAARTGRDESVSVIAAAAAAGDAAARATFAALGTHLAEILRPWASGFGAQQLVVGGNIARAWEHFCEPLQNGLPGIDCRPTALFEHRACWELRRWRMR